jgi:hypothetical protein
MSQATKTVPDGYHDPSQMPTDKLQKAVAAARWDSDHKLADDLRWLEIAEAELEKRHALN